MADLTRVLFVSGEVAPFTRASEISNMVRKLPELLQEHGEYETRIMMPRYGIISERRNRLHEVIRLSGAEVSVADRSETLKVKVASIPGIRLQVYFMDNSYYFKRKGIYADKDGKVFDDNVERALFFGKAVLETTKNLGWKPDIVHAFGAISAFLPSLLRSEYAQDPLFQNSRAIYTPDVTDVDAHVTGDKLAGLGLPGADTPGRSLSRAGFLHADVVAPVAGMDLNGDADYVRLSLDEEDLIDRAKELYAQVLSEGRVLA